MTFLTFIIIAPIAFGVAYGFYRGFFKELVGIIYIVVALFAARYLGAFVADILSSIFGWSLLVTKPISFILIFAATVVVLKMTANILTKLSEIVVLSWLNRLLGALLGGLKWLLIVSIVLNIISFFYKMTAKENSLQASSAAYAPVEKSISVVVPLLNFDKFRQDGDAADERDLNKDKQKKP